MPSAGLWYESSTRPSIERAVHAWQRILDRPDSVVIVRNGIDLAAQTVRVTINPGSKRPDEISSTAQYGAIVYGVLSHPNPAITDTNILRGDRFYYGNRWYEVESVLRVPGEIQAACIAQEF